MISKVFSIGSLKEIKQRRWAVVSYSTISLAFLWLYVSIFPSFQKESARFDELLESYPKALLEAFNIDQLQLSTLEGYISAEHFSFVWPMMAILLIVSFAGSTIAGEIEKSTMSILLSLPQNRKRIFASKYFAGLTIILVFCIFSILALIPLAAIYGLSLNVNHLMITFFVCLLFGWALLSIGMAVSSFVKEKSSAYFIIGGGLLIMYVLNIVSGLVSSLEWTRFGSLFYYFQPSNIIMSGQVNNASMLVLLCLAIISTIIGVYRFVRSDFSV